ncbi:hypothetical protein JOF47_001510 [Paeniglutamicibacter kerguelensis]|uniref:Transposase n=1 Tax=Paeniglutamicibacter kerguelensis TaxID=254788 RepID=A0ABS4XC06_9MICC|nr:hypothetical protein [Paeniglutamicibacter kerguelensis]
MTEGINHCYRTRIPWCDPPDHLGSSKTARKRHRRYAGDGTRDSVLATLLGHAEAKGPINCEVSVDSTVPPPHGDLPDDKNLPTEPADHAVGRPRGGLTTEIHALIDGNRQPLQGTDQVLAQPPRTNANARRNSRTPPSRPTPNAARSRGSARIRPGLNQPTTHHPHRHRWPHQGAHEPGHRRIKPPQAVVVSRLAGQVGKYSPEMLPGMAQPAGLGHEAQQCLHQRQRHRLGVRNTRADPDTRTVRNPFRMGLQQVIRCSIECRGKGVQMASTSTSKSMT